MQKIFFIILKILFLSGCIEFEVLTEPSEVHIQSKSCQKSIHSKVRRLTQKQFMNTIKLGFSDFFEQHLSYEDYSFSDQVPKVGSFKQGLSLNEVQLQSYFSYTEELVQNIVNHHKALSRDTALKNCLQSLNNNCLEELFITYGNILWRKNPEQDEVQNFLSKLNSLSNLNQEDKVKMTLHHLLLAPQLLYIMESDNTDHTLAQIMAYQLTNRPPNQELKNIVSQGQLKNQLDQVTQGLMNSEYFQEVLVDFFTDYLKLEKVKTNTIFRESVSSTQRQDLFESFQLSLEEQLEGAQTLTEIFLKKDTKFYLKERIRSFFNHGQNLNNHQWHQVSMNQQQRPGLAGHPSIWAAKGGIMPRGVFVLEQLLCRHLPAPPDNVEGVPEDELANIDPQTTSTRELIHLSHSGQPQCYTCHQIIDPAGYGLEQFDEVGRFQLTEKNGLVTIDASGNLQTGKMNIHYNNTNEYLNELFASEKMNDCLTQRLVEHFMEDFEDDLKQCHSEHLTNGSSEKDLSIKEKVAKLFQSTLFKGRRI